jgi:uncharacterized membrane protein YdjX (TVP38/TMEM64 family)
MIHFSWFRVSVGRQRSRPEGDCLEETQAFILSLGWLAPAAFILVLAVVVVISPLPGWPLVVASPAMFGLVQGVIYSNLGVGLGAAVACAAVWASNGLAFLP